jgi:hypothetical protein
MEYTPAPGQLINVNPWGTPEGKRSIEGGINGTLSLGAFGGYVVFRFDQAVENDPHNPYGVDFTIFGNPMPDWSEPGVVWVMEDVNENGEPDETWYELAGSDHWFSGTVKNYRVSYLNPGGTAATDIPWEDHAGNQGIIRANSIYTQTYYPLHDSFPHIDAISYELGGTLLQGMVFEHSTGIKSRRRSFGYADNQLRGSAPFTIPDNPYTMEIEHSGGDAFDIAWAVDSSDQYVELERVHFIKVQSGLLADGGRLGELSTELTGAVDVLPDPAISGETAMVVVKDLPPRLRDDAFQLEFAVFQNGRLDPEASVQWTTSLPGASVDENHVLRVSEEGALSLTAALKGRPEINTTVSTTVRFTQTHAEGALAGGSLLYPNPTTGQFRIRIPDGSRVSIHNAAGQLIMQLDDYQQETVLDISSFPAGIYPVQIAWGHSLQRIKVLKQ